MAKIEIQTTEQVAEITQEMINNIKREMAKFNKYDDFLYSVGAMKKNGTSLPTVMQFENKWLNEYEDKHVKKHIGNSINNLFVFKKYANCRKNTAIEGKPVWVDTGYFMPRSFWDYVSRQK